MNDDAAIPDCDVMYPILMTFGVMPGALAVSAPVALKCWFTSGRRDFERDAPDAAVVPTVAVATATVTHATTTDRFQRVDDTIPP